MIDIHCHTTNRELSHTVDRDASIPVILRRMREFRVDMTVLLATYFPHKGTGISNYRLFHWIQKHSGLKMFGSLNFGTFFRQGLNELEEMADCDYIKGVKVYWGYQGITEDKFKTVLKTVCLPYKLPMMLHSGSCIGTGREAKIASWIVQLLEDFPQVPFIFSHLANPRIKSIIGICQEHPNAYTDMSGLLNSKSDQEYLPAVIEMTRRFLGECGPRKLLFGTDFPVQTHKDSVDILEKAAEGLSKADLERVYSGVDSCV